MHRLLERQLKRHFGSLAAVPPDLASFLRVVDATYTDSDTDRALAERSLELASQELLQSNQSLRAAYDALKLVDRERTQFLNNAAHELSTPLTPIKLQIHMMRSRGAVTADSRTMDILERNFDRLGHLVKDLLDSARIQSDHLRVDLQEMDLAQTLVDGVETYSALAQKAGVAIEFREPPALPVNGDRRRLGQVVDNLVSNAIKFTPKGGKVSVWCDVEQGQLVVSVSDSGLGIRAEDVGKLFKPFSQVHDRMQVSEPGTGLGLYISRSILEAHGGSIWAESRGLGHGSTFRFRLPLRTSRAQASLPTATLPRNP